MEAYANVCGKGVWPSYDLKKILKMFFRWHNLSSREFPEAGDPQETKSVKMKPIRDVLARKEILTESDKTIVCILFSKHNEIINTKIKYKLCT